MHPLDILQPAKSPAYDTVYLPAESAMFNSIFVGRAMSDRPRGARPLVFSRDTSRWHRTMWTTTESDNTGAVDKYGDCIMIFDSANGAYSFSSKLAS